MASAAEIKEALRECIAEELGALRRELQADVGMLKESIKQLEERGGVGRSMSLTQPDPEWEEMTTAAAPSACPRQSIFGGVAGGGLQMGAGTGTTRSDRRNRHVDMKAAREAKHAAELATAFASEPEVDVTGSGATSGTVGESLTMRCESASNNRGKGQRGSILKIGGASSAQYQGSEQIGGLGGGDLGRRMSAGGLSRRMSGGGIGRRMSSNHERGARRSCAEIRAEMARRPTSERLRDQELTRAALAGEDMCTFAAAGTEAGGDAVAEGEGGAAAGEKEPGGQKVRLPPQSSSAPTRKPSSKLPSKVNEALLPDRESILKEGWDMRVQERGRGINARLLAQDSDLAECLEHLKRQQQKESHREQRDNGANGLSPHAASVLLRREAGLCDGCLGGGSGLTSRLEQLTIDPARTPRRWWDRLMVVMLVYSVSITPLRLAFAAIMDDAGDGWRAIDFAVDVAFIFDIGLNCITGHMQRGELVTSHRAIVARYARSGELAIDVLAALPLDFVFGVGSEARRTSDTARLLRVLKIFRLQRLKRYWSQLEDYVEHHTMISTHIFQVVYLLVCFVIIVHWFGCIWLLVGDVTDSTSLLWPQTGAAGTDSGESAGAEEGTAATAAGAASARAFIAVSAGEGGSFKSMGVMYTEAFYWALMMSTGLGVEFLPTTVGETLYEAAVTALGVVMYAYFLGSATTAITNMNVQSAQRQVQLDLMREFLRRRKVPERLRNSVVAHVDHMLNRQQALDELKMLKGLPQALKLQLDMVLHSKFLIKVPMFRYCDARCLITLVQCMQLCMYLPGDVVVCEGMSGSALYLIAKGRVKVLVGTEELAWLSDYDFFGEQSFLDGTTVGASVVSADLSDIMLLFRADFMQILEYFPDLRAHVERCQRDQRSKYHAMFTRGVGHLGSGKRLIEKRLTLSGLKKKSFGRKGSSNGSTYGGGGSGGGGGADVTVDGGDGGGEPKAWVETPTGSRLQQGPTSPEQQRRVRLISAAGPTPVLAPKTSPTERISGFAEEPATPAEKPLRGGDTGELAALCARRADLVAKDHGDPDSSPTRSILPSGAFSPAQVAPCGHPTTSAKTSPGDLKNGAGGHQLSSDIEDDEMPASQRGLSFTLAQMANSTTLAQVDSSGASSSAEATSKIRGTESRVRAVNALKRGARRASLVGAFQRGTAAEASNNAPTGANGTAVVSTGQGEFDGGSDDMTNIQVGSCGGESIAAKPKAPHEALRSIDEEGSFGQ